MLNFIRSYYNVIKFKIQEYLFSKIIRDENAWFLFDRAGIEGFGVNLIRLYFPIYYDKETVRASFSDSVKIELETIIKKNNFSLSCRDSVLSVLNELLNLPVHESDKYGPYLDNYYFGIYDAAILGTMMKVFKPCKLIEIGSGISTKYMKLFKDIHALETEIVSIDPFPRADIDGIPDILIRNSLEKTILTNHFSFKADDILFLDGSHYVFQGNDTLTFFFHMLPMLPAGMIIHIHDIYLPYDYSNTVSNQLWSEQYLLASMMIGGFNRYEVLYPAYFLSQTDEKIIESLTKANDFLYLKHGNLKQDHTKGYSFWMRKTESK